MLHRVSSALLGMISRLNIVDVRDTFLPTVLTISYVQRVIIVYNDL
jgi:hypothetical protein